MFNLFFNVVDINVIGDTIIHDDVSLGTLNEMVFNPFDLDDNAPNDMAYFSDIDPDLNYFNTLGLRTAAVNCSYFTETSFNDSINGRDDEFSLFHLNIRSLPKHYSDFTDYISCLNYDFTVLGLSANSCDLYNLNNYQHVSQYRENRRGGGVSLLIKDNVPFSVMNELSVNNDLLECMFVQFGKSDLSSKPVIVGILYRPPGSDLEEFCSEFNLILTKLKNERSNVYIMGDFNINLLNVERHAGTSEFLDLMYSFSFYPLISKPTRVQDTSATLIDNIFCNFENMNNFMNGILFTDLSDHFPIFCLTETQQHIEDAGYFYSRNYCERNIERFLQRVDSFDWNEIFSFDDCQESFTFFHENLLKLHDDSFPAKRTVKGYANRKPWLTSGLKKSIKKKYFT